MATSELLRIGVDVGGTNTDAVILCGRSLISWTKVFTTTDITTGISQAIARCLEDAGPAYKDKKVALVSVGTTHFVNAVVQRQNLAKVAIIRLCGPASRALPPLSDFPEDLAEMVHGAQYMISGGYEFNGDEIASVRKTEVLECARDMQEKGLRHIVVSGCFSPVNPKQEIEVGELLLDADPDFSITLAHDVGHMGLLERENAAVMNESLKPLCHSTIEGFTKAFKKLGLNCPFYLTQNDGTLISSEECIDYPVRTFASGPTNSMRGAAFLSGEEDAIVVDLGGTTTDVGVLVKGFPREAANRVKRRLDKIKKILSSLDYRDLPQVGGVNTNFRMPDVLSIGLGGGSIVRERDRRMMRETLCVATAMRVGPSSVGHLLAEQAIVFGGSEVTATDIVSAAGLVTTIGDWQRAKNLIPKMIVDVAMREMSDMLERAIDSLKVSAEDQPVILVGGGSILIDERKPLNGASRVLKPKYYQVANAVGAALSQIGHCVDRVYCFDLIPRDQALADAKNMATAAVRESGAVASTIQIVEVQETPQAYVSHGAVRVRVKAVGDLILDQTRLDTDTDPSCPSPSKTRAPRSKLDQDEHDGDMSRDFDMSTVSSPVITDHNFNIDPKTGEWFVDERDVECICIGAGIMGCGGGGSPYLARLRTLRLLRQGKKIRIIDPSRLGTTPKLDGHVAVVGFMGAPTVLVEKLIGGTEVSGAVRLAESIVGSDLNECGVRENVCGGYKEIAPEDLHKLKPRPGASKIVALMCGEIGGLNSAEPLAVAAEMDLPVVDCDGMGRAFPELQMCYPFMSGNVAAYPATLVDEKGTRFAASHTDSAKDLETFFRNSVIQMGCMGGVCLAVLNAEQVQKNSIQHSYSRAWQIGHAVLRARELKLSPIAVMLKSVQGKRLIHGKISDVVRNTQDGFVRGQLTIRGYGRFQGRTLFVKFQNENLIAQSRHDDDADDCRRLQTLASTPDLISVLDSVTGEPISTEEVGYGMRVAVVAMACSPEMRTPRSLEFVGPKYFGYDDVEFEPLCDYVQFFTIPPSYNN